MCPFIKKDDMEDDRHALYSVILYLIDTAEENTWKSSIFFHEQVVNQDRFNIRRTTNVLGLLRDKGYLSKTQKLAHKDAFL